MPRSFLVKKYLKQRYDEDQIKLQALKDAAETINNNNNSTNNNNNNNSNNNSNSSHVIASILNNPSPSLISNKSYDNVVVAPYTPPVASPHDTFQPLSIKLSNGYICEVNHIQTGSSKMEEAVIPKVEYEVAAHENSLIRHHPYPHHQPRRSVIVTNSNHPANRHFGLGSDPYEVIKPVHSPPAAHEAGEQCMPYDYSLPRADRPPSAHAPSSALSPLHGSMPSPSPAHVSSPAHIPVSSPPPAHHGFEPQSARPNSSQQAEFLPADHPFNHPLIQQLINERLHVPTEKSPEHPIHQNVQHPQYIPTQDDKSRNSSSISHDDNEDIGFSAARLHHQQHQHQLISDSHTTESSSIERSRDFEMYESNLRRMDDEEERHRLATGSLHHQYLSHHYHHFPTSDMPTAASASSIVTSAHLAPIHATHSIAGFNAHTFPPSPSPTIPSSSPTLPYSETKSHFILPPPSPLTPGLTNSSPSYSHTRQTMSPLPMSPASPAPSTSSSSSMHSSSSDNVLHGIASPASMNANITTSNILSNMNKNGIINNNNASDEDVNAEVKAEAEANSKPNEYTYDAFLISDGRSRKRQHDQMLAREAAAGRLRYTCNECGKDYATSSNLSRHKQTHRALDSKNAKKCPHCDKVYVSMPAMSMHILTHDLKHACNICGKTFSRPWLLQGHMRSHTGEKPFGCAHCGKAFADRSNLRAHMQTHSAFKHFACSKCNKSFALKSYLNKHLESSCVKEQ